MSFNLLDAKALFPILSQEIKGHPLVYLDNAATSQKPIAVIEAMNRYYLNDNANIHRAVYELSARATDQFEKVRKKVCVFLNAMSEEEIIFTSGTTGSINLVAHSWGNRLKAGDEILITHMEHHSNIVPWQMLTERTGAKLLVAPITSLGELDLEAFEKLLTPKVKIVSLSHCSNSLGTINPLEDIIPKIRRLTSAVILVDGAQSAAHFPIDVVKLDCDFFAFSGHKVFGPTGVGVLYAKAKHLESMTPFFGGGEMILTVKFEKSTYKKGPAKFEAGTPPIAEVIGLGAALDFINSFSRTEVMRHETELETYATQKLSEISKLRIIGQSNKKAPIVSFVIDDIHAHDVGTILDQEGVAVRTGHHCTQPVMDFFNVPATTRASMSIFNTKSDIDALVAGLQKVREVFK